MSNPSLSVDRVNQTIHVTCKLPQFRVSVDLTESEAWYIIDKLGRAIRYLKVGHYTTSPTTLPESSPAKEPQTLPSETASCTDDAPNAAT